MLPVTFANREVAVTARNSTSSASLNPLAALSVMEIRNPHVLPNPLRNSAIFKRQPTHPCVGVVRSSLITFVLSCRPRIFDRVSLARSRSTVKGLPGTAAVSPALYEAGFLPGTGSGAPFVVRAPGVCVVREFSLGEPVCKPRQAPLRPFLGSNLSGKDCDPTTDAVPSETGTHGVAFLSYSFPQDRENSSHHLIALPHCGRRRRPSSLPTIPQYVASCNIPPAKEQHR